MAAHSMKVAYFAFFLLILTPLARSQSTVTALRRFGNLLYREHVLTLPGGSRGASPASAAVLLALMSMAAEGDTRNELQDAIYTRDQDDTRTKYGDLINTLTSWQSVGLKIINKVYIMNGYTIGANFLDDALNVFNSEVESIDFTDTVAAANKINSWVESKTENVMKMFLHGLEVGSQTKILLVNALFFRAKWDKPFNIIDTKPKQNFYLLNGKTLSHFMMNQVDTFLYGPLPTLDANVKQAVEMFFKGNELSMVIVLPNKIDGLLAIEQKLQESTDWVKLLKSLKPTQISLSIPRFGSNSIVYLEDVLPKLGVEMIFDPNNAELSPLLDNYSDPLPVSLAAQRAYIIVNEDGNVVSGASAAAARRPSLPSRPPISFVADHSFLYMVRDKLGHIVFMGSYKGYVPK